MALLQVDYFTDFTEILLTMPLRAFVQPPPLGLLGDMFYGSSSRKHVNQFKTPIKTESVFPPISVPAPVKPGNDNRHYSVNIVESEQFSEIVNIDQEVEKSAQSIGDSARDQEANSASVAHNLGHPSSFSRDLSKPSSSAQDLSKPGHSSQDMVNPSCSAQDLTDIVQSVQNMSDSTQYVHNLSDSTQTVQNLSNPTQSVQNLNNPTQSVQNLNNPTQSVQNWNKPTKTVHNFNNPTQTVQNFSSIDYSAQNLGKPGCSAQVFGNYESSVQNKCNPVSSNPVRNPRRCTVCKSLAKGHQGAIGRGKCKNSRANSSFIETADLAPSLGSQPRESITPPPPFEDELFTSEETDRILDTVFGPRLSCLKNLEDVIVNVDESDSIDTSLVVQEASSESNDLAVPEAYEQRSDKVQKVSKRPHVDSTSAPKETAKKKMKTVKKKASSGLQYFEGLMKNMFSTPGMFTSFDITNGKRSNGPKNQVGDCCPEPSYIATTSNSNQLLSSTSCDLPRTGNEGIHIFEPAGISCSVSKSAGISCSVSKSAGVSCSVSKSDGISSSVSKAAGTSCSVSAFSGVSCSVSEPAEISYSVSQPPGISCSVTKSASALCPVSTPNRILCSASSMPVISSSALDYGPPCSVATSQNLPPSVTKRSTSSPE